MSNGYRLVLSLAVLIILASCNSSGDGGGGTSSSSGFVQTYTSSATAGEILTYTIDTQHLTYSYKIIYSAYGLTNTTGSGTLVANADGSFSPSNAPNTRVYALENGLLVGTVMLTLNNVPRTVPIVGMSSPVSSAAGLQGIYNFVGIQCANQTFGVYTGCTSSYGTVQLDNGGHYTACPSGNIANGLGSCTGPTTGAISLLGNGVWQASRTGSSNVNYFLAFHAPDGQNVLLLDLNDPGGYGYGAMVFSTQAAYSEPLADGTWFYQSNAGTGGSLTVAGTHVSAHGQNLTVNFDSPWTGLNAVSDNGFALLAGTGAYAYINPLSPGFLEVGMKK